MVLLARRAARLARSTLSAAVVRNNSSISTASYPDPVSSTRALLDQITSLLAPPTYLHSLVFHARKLDPNLSPHLLHMALELWSNPSLDEEKRWEDIRSILKTRNNGLNNILNVALKPASSHEEIIERSMQKSFQGQAKKLKLILMCMLLMRFPDAPFMDADLMLRVLREARVSYSMTSALVVHWLDSLPMNLLRLELNWERANLTDAALQSIRTRAVEQLHAVEGWFAPLKRLPQISALELRSQFMTAYNATRVAPDDVSRHWRACSLVPEYPDLYSEWESSLGSAPNLDALRDRWSRLTKGENVDRWPTGYLDDLLALYAQHLVRLGAKDEAGYLVARHLPHYDAEWMFAPGELVQKYGRSESSAALEPHASTNHDRTVAKTLHANGLDFASVLLARKSTVTTAIRGFVCPRCQYPRILLRFF